MNNVVAPTELSQKGETVLRWILEDIEDTSSDVLLQSMDRHIVSLLSQIASGRKKHDRLTEATANIDQVLPELRLLEGEWALITVEVLEARRRDLQKLLERSELPKWQRRLDDLQRDRVQVVKRASLARLLKRRLDG